MKSSLQYIVAACAIATVFTGCEWGGAHDSTWNDAYSWANFTGTYRFVKAVVVRKNATDDGGSTSDDNGGGNNSTSSTKTKIVSGADNAVMSSPSSASGTLKAGSGIVPGSVKMKITTKGKEGEINISDDGTGKLPGCGTIDYSSGNWSIVEKPGLISDAGSKIAITYQFKQKIQINPSNPGGDSESDAGDLVSTINLSYLNVIQKGNTLTMTGDSGSKYTGRITGASMGADTYTQAQGVNLSFEVSNGKGDTIVGNFTGTWSGAADLKSGTMTDRKISGTHSRAGNFIGVAADLTINVPDATVSEYDSQGNTL